MLRCCRAHAALDTWRGRRLGSKVRNFRGDRAHHDALETKGAPTLSLARIYSVIILFERAKQRPNAALVDSLADARGMTPNASPRSSPALRFWKEGYSVPV